MVDSVTRTKWITEYKFINGYPDNIQKRMNEMAKDGWHMEEIDMTQDIVRALMSHHYEIIAASPPDHPSISSLG